MNKPRIFLDLPPEAPAAAPAPKRPRAAAKAAAEPLDASEPADAPAAPESGDPAQSGEAEAKPKRRRRRRSRSKAADGVAVSEDGTQAVSADAAAEAAEEEREAPRKRRRRKGQAAERPQKPPKPVLVPMAPVREDAELDEEYLRAFSTEEIMELPLLQFVGKIILVESDRRLHQAMKVLHTQTLIGFDTETRPIFKKGQTPPPALLQLATDEDVYLFQLNKLEEKAMLAEVLAARHIIKSGVSVRDDLKGLKQHFEFHEHNFVDLGDVAKKMNMRTHGLRNLTANLMGQRISKGAQCSNWARENLSTKQIVYAATDAWISRVLFLRFQELGVL